MSETTRAGAIRLAMLALAESLFAEEIEAGTIQVSLGSPGKTQLDDIVAIGDTTMTQAPGPLSPQRVRDEEIVQDVEIDCWRAGGEEQESIVHDRAHDIAACLENALRKTDPTLGGLALWGFLMETRLETSSTTGESTGGREASLLCRFQFRTRIRTT